MGCRPWGFSEVEQKKQAGEPKESSAEMDVTQSHTGSLTTLFEACARGLPGAGLQRDQSGLFECSSGNL